MERLRCAVERITYRNEENGYTVLRCRAKGFQDLVTVVGSMPETHVGSVLQLEGEWRLDAKYGRQFSVSAFEETMPATAYGIEKYLGSGLVKGIGPKFAHRIVRAFGAETLDIIEETPERLLEVPGIGQVRVDRIRKSWAEQKEIRNIMLFLQGHDVSTGHATKIYKTYGADSIRVVQENPYRLADDIWGIGFRTADTIARRMGFEPDRPERLRSGLLYTLNRLADEGHCFATGHLLLQAGQELLEVEAGPLETVLRGMTDSQDLITEEYSADNGARETAIYLPPYYHAEAGTAKRLKELLRALPSVTVRQEGLEERVQRRTGMQYDEVQLRAIRTAAESKVLVLTGGPGTGKTTTTQGMIAAFRETGAKILLAAPTGRAAKRLTESTGLEAKTIHRLLEMKPPEGYQRNAENPLEGDVLIVDECSMIDIMLMYSLLRAVPDSMTLILVGPTSQRRRRECAAGHHCLGLLSGHPPDAHLPPGTDQPHHHERPPHQCRRNAGSLQRPEYGLFLHGRGEGDEGERAGYRRSGKCFGRSGKDRPGAGAAAAAAALPDFSPGNSGSDAHAAGSRRRGKPEPAVAGSRKPGRRRAAARRYPVPEK